MSTRNFRSDGGHHFNQTITRTRESNLKAEQSQKEKARISKLYVNVNNSRPIFGNGPNTVSESTVSNTELSEFFGPHRVPGRGLSEFLSAYCLSTKVNSPSFSRNSPSLPQNSVSSLFRNSTLETVFYPFPKYQTKEYEDRKGLKEN